METQQIWANLAVADVMRTKNFYSALGFAQNGEATEELVSFFFSDKKFIIHFFNRSKIEQSTQTSFIVPAGESEVMFSLSAKTAQEVSTWLDLAAKYGGTVFKQAARDAKGFFWGGFADPDGHRFNVLLMEKGM